MLTTLLRFVAGRDDRLRYSARIEQEGGAFVVTFRDFPHIRATGESADAAKESAIDSLLYAFEDCLYREIPIPRASKRQKRMRGYMFGAFVWLIKRWVRVEPPPELTLSYEVGWDAGETLDDRLNPFTEGSKASSDWKGECRDG